MTPSDNRIAPELDLMILAFPMHLAWEFLQAPLFRTMQDASHMDGIRICLQAALGDMAIVLAAFWAASVLAGTREWVARPRRPTVAVWLAVGLVATMAIEFYSTEVAGRWTYGESMPRLPLIGTGLAPVVQWIVVPLLVLWYMQRLTAKAAGSNLANRQTDDGA